MMMGVDACPNDAANDADEDGVCGDVDQCEGDCLQVHMIQMMMA